MQLLLQWRDKARRPWNQGAPSPTYENVHPEVDSIKLNALTATRFVFCWPKVSSSSTTSSVESVVRFTLERVPKKRVTTPSSETRMILEVVLVT